MANPELTTLQEFLLVNVTSFVALLGGLLVWIGFALQALIIRRFERVYQGTPRWQLMMAAPAGLAAYIVIQVVASLSHRQLDAVGLWSGYALLGLSGVLSAWCQFGFYRLVARLYQEP